MVVNFLYGGVVVAVLFLWVIVSTQMIRHSIPDWLMFLAVQLMFAWYFWSIYGLYKHRAEMAYKHRAEMEQTALATPEKKEHGSESLDQEKLIASMWQRDAAPMTEEEKERIAHERGVALCNDAWQRETSALSNRMLLANAYLEWKERERKKTDSPGGAFLENLKKMGI